MGMENYAPRIFGADSRRKKGQDLQAATALTAAQRWSRCMTGDKISGTERGRGSQNPKKILSLDEKRVNRNEEQKELPLRTLSSHAAAQVPKVLRPEHRRRKTLIYLSTLLGGQPGTTTPRAHTFCRFLQRSGVVLMYTYIQGWFYYYYGHPTQFSSNPVKAPLSGTGWREGMGSQYDQLHNSASPIHIHPGPDPTPLPAVRQAAFPAWDKFLSL